MTARIWLGLSLMIITACGKPDAQPVPEVAVEPGPAADPKKEPEKPKKRELPPVKLGGDASDPVFAGKKLSEWRAELRVPGGKDPNRIPMTDTRTIVAIKVMEAYGQAAEPAIPDLIALRVSRDSHSYINAALESIGKVAVCRQIVAKWKADKKLGFGDWGFVVTPPADLAVPVLTEIASGSDETQCEAAARLLATHGASARPAVPALTARLKAMVGPKPPANPSFNQISIASSLAQIDPDGTADDVLPVLLAAPHAPGDYQSEQVAKALAQVGPKAAKALVAKAAVPDKSRPNSKVNTSAIAQLWGFKPEHIGGITNELIALLGQASNQEKWYVLTVLENAGPAAKDALPAVLKEAAREIGPAGKPTPPPPPPPPPLPGSPPPAPKAPLPAVPSVVKENATTGTRSDAIRCALKLGAAPAEVVAFAKEPAKDPNIYTYSHCFRELASCYDELHPFYVAMLKDANERVRWSAANLILQSDPANAAAIRALLESRSKDTVTPQASAFGKGVLKPAALPALRALLDDKNPAVQQQAMQHVLQLDPNDARAMALGMQKIYREEPFPSPPGQPKVPPRIFLNEGLIAGLGRAGAGGIPKLLDLCKHEKPAVRARASEELLSSDPADVKASVAALAAALSNADDQVCFNVLAAMVKAGAAAKPHLDAIREAAKRTDPLVRLAAAHAHDAADPSDRAIDPVLAALVKPAKERPPLKLIVRKNEILGRFPQSYSPGYFSYEDFHTSASELFFVANPEAAILAGAFTVPRQARFGK